MIVGEAGQKLAELLAALPAKLKKSLQAIVWDRAGVVHFAAGEPFHIAFLRRKNVPDQIAEALETRVTIWSSAQLEHCRAFFLQTIVYFLALPIAVIQQGFEFQVDAHFSPQS